MKILVTGATGFIGNYVIEELLKNNIEVIATSANKQRAKTLDWYQKTDFIEYDINNSVNDNENLYQYFNSPDKVIHLAWENLPNYNELFHIEKNLFSNYYFLKKLIISGLKDLNVIGTCFEYGMMNGHLNESIITDPKNSYAIAKDSLRKFLELLNVNYKFSLKWIRLFYIYGKGQSEKSLYSQMEKALENNNTEFKMSAGEQVRDFLSVENVANHIAKISLQNNVTGIINCCSGEPQSVRKFVENYFSSKGKDIKLILGYYPYPDYEPLAFWGDDTKLKKI